MLILIQQILGGLMILLLTIFIPGTIMLLLATWRLRSGKQREGSVCSFFVNHERHTGTIIKSGKIITVVRSHVDLQKYNVFTKELNI